MEVSRNSCRLCLSESDFNVFLFGSYSRRTHIVDKILVCLKVVINCTDRLTTICYRCANNVELYYDFITLIKKSQNRLKIYNESNERYKSVLDESFNCRHRYVTSDLREQMEDADYTFRRIFLSCYSQPIPTNKEENVWKSQDFNTDHNKINDLRNCSRDLFETQSQKDEQSASNLDRKLTPDEIIIKRLRASMKSFENAFTSQPIVNNKFSIKKTNGLGNSSQDLFETLSQQDEQ